MTRFPRTILLVLCCLTCFSHTLALQYTDQALSNFDVVSAKNGWGPVETNHSNGERSAGDGHALSVAGKAVQNGLGVHAPSDVEYDLGGQCTRFTVSVGVDDETKRQGSVQFQIWGDGAKLTDSRVMRGGQTSVSLTVDTVGIQRLHLIVTDAGDGTGFDHADWLNPVLHCVVWSAPITITKGGIYTGAWRSLNPTVPAVRLQTSEPVTIRNSLLQGRGALITGFHNRLTLLGSTLVGQNPRVSGWAPGRAVILEEFYSFRAESNLISGTGGFYLRDWRGNASQGDTVMIRYNDVRDVDGRLSTGADTWLPSGQQVANFLQLNTVQRVAGAEIAWNQVINRPGYSLVEDNLSVFLSSGTASSPIRIHDNYIQGAYPNDPAGNSTYSGGGILLGDGAATTSDQSGHVWAYHNQVVSTTNYGISIAGGRDMRIFENRIFSSGLLPDGRRIAAQNVGIYLWNYSNVPPALFGDNVVRDNIVSWVKPQPSGQRPVNPWWLPACTNDHSNICLNNTVSGVATPSQEAEEYAHWRNKLKEAGIAIGPQQ